jgi:hypothetical protein
MVVVVLAGCHSSRSCSLLFKLMNWVWMEMQVNITEVAVLVALLLVMLLVMLLVVLDRRIIVKRPCLVFMLMTGVWIKKQVHGTVFVVLVVVVMVAIVMMMEVLDRCTIVRCLDSLFMPQMMMMMVQAWMLVHAARHILRMVVSVVVVQLLVAALDQIIIVAVSLGQADVRQGCDGDFEAPEPLVAVRCVRNRCELPAAAVEEERCCEVLVLAAHRRRAGARGRHDGLDGVHVGRDTDDARREEEWFIAVVGHVDDVALHRAAAALEQVESLMDVEQHGTRTGFPGARHSGQGK